MSHSMLFKHTIEVRFVFNDTYCLDFALLMNNGIAFNITHSKLEASWTTLYIDLMK